ncbi:rho guanine nucleotide exchange factor 38 [Pygocentrus nattereri]|uniref:Dynamin-binding protein n=1 Tax=Pygocentrus nattereri TaxID=42514 RepID=A0A3B4D4T4_PYGNA|nr:rho guanine nucleotide exchange factor 38 [Pygocentrus nattereri]
MDPKEPGGNERENEKEEKKEKERGLKRRNRLFLRYLERRRTDTIVDEDSGKGDISINTLVRRSQSDKTEYSAKLKEKMAPHDLLSPTSPSLDPEEIRQRKMVKRSKVIDELVRTEGDYLTDLELCIREVLQPLRNTQVVDVERLFTNMESVCAVSGELLHRLQEATSEPDPETQLIGEVFIQVKAAVEEVYKIYCYHHDEASALLKTYEKQEEIQQHFKTCISALKQIYDQQGKPNLLDMGSLIIKPVQRVMKYPLLLAELWQATPTDHPDHQPLQEALTAAKIINININEFKRRKDIVLKYKRSDDEGTLKGKLNKFSIHSLRKKSDRITGYFKILTGVEPQMRDAVFDKEEKQFRNLEKAIRQLVKNISLLQQNAQEMISVAVRNVEDLDAIMKDPDKIDTNGYQHRRNGHDPYKQLSDRLERLVVAPLSALQAMFSAPQKLIQKRYDKLLDCCSCPDEASSCSEEQLQAQRDYQALNAQLGEELQRFNRAASTILTNSLLCMVGLLRGLVEVARPRVQQLPAPLSNISEVQNSIMEEINNLAFVRDNSQKLMERKVSFEKRERKNPAPEVQRQTEAHRARLLAQHPQDRIYQLKRNCNACQDQDISLLEGELVALLEDYDPLGSTSRWLVDTGSMQGYVYSTFLKAYNPQRDVSERPDDFDNLSLFVSGSRSSSLYSFNQQGEPQNTQEQPDIADEQHFYAVYAFKARCEQELTLQEYQPVRILQFSDLGGNKDWWLAEANGQRGYVPANYLGKMSYA